MGGEQVVQVREIRGEHVADREVALEEVAEEEPGLLPHGLAQLGAPIREDIGIGLVVVEGPGIEPLSCEVIDERLGLVVLEHPLDLGLDLGRILELALARRREELVVRHGAPQEIREARGQLEIGERVR